MARSAERERVTVSVYLEIGKKRIFAGVIDWPGWCRAGRDETSALQAMIAYAPRYASALRTARLGFHSPADVSVFNLVERLEGDATTDFGAPGMPPASDARPTDDAELQRMQTLLRACWRAFDAAVQAATGKELRKGPRGGGRAVEEIARHVLDAEAGCLARIGGKFKPGASDNLAARREMILDGLAARSASARGEVPRGGAHWTPRYFVRRTAWHVLDHAWEIEDRVM